MRKWEIMMKKKFTCLLFILFVVGLCGSVHAKVKGQCSDCHTMHNSQGGLPVERFTAFVDGETANPSLLVTTCVGCHSSTEGNIWQDTEARAPIVYNVQEPTYNTRKGLAGGNFYYVAQDQAKGHNVIGIAGFDTTFNGKPVPGGATTYSETTQLTCAGASGCHGEGTEDDLNAIKNAHHTDDSGGLNGTSVGLSYRFLEGIVGIEDPDWEQTASASDHNEYKGASDAGDGTTISSFCARCHGDYHSTVGIGRNASPWLRHPADITLRTDGEYAGYNPPTDYSNDAPVAYTDPSAPSRTTAVVTCLSCHRAHGSPYFKMVRWDYKSPDLLDALQGCSVCHTSKQ